MRGMLSHDVGDSCFHTSMDGDALNAFTAIVPVTGSHASAARSPIASSRTCFTPPTQADTIACDGAAEPDTPTCTQPVNGQKPDGGSVSGRGGAVLALSV